MSANLPASISNQHEASFRASEDFVTMTIADQLFGIPVLQVQDVLGPQRITRVPLAPVEIAGSLNLRGRIVTAVDVRVRLGLPPLVAGKSGMSIVVDLNDELYSLMVDSVGEVLSLPSRSFERSLSTMDPKWRDVSNGIYRLDGKLLITLDIARLLSFASLEAA